MQKPPPRDLTDVVRLRRDLIAQGYTDQQIRALVKSRVLHRVRWGAYVSAALWSDSSPTDRHRILARAVLRAGHPLMVLTHVSAAVERGADVWGIPLDEVHTTRTDGVGARREAGVVHHVGSLTEDEVEVVHGVRTSPAARSAVEVSTISGLEPALVVANSMLHLGLITADELAACAADLKHWPATLNNHLLLHLADARMESVAETRVAYLCWAQHLHHPEPQVEIFDEYGTSFARVDFAWPEHGVFLEFDGRMKYDLFRRPGESLEAFLMREKKREERICQLTGWVCIRITWTDLEHPVATGQRIRRLLASRRTAPDLARSS